MIDWTKPVRTKNGGVPVEIISTQVRSDTFTVIGYIGESDCLNYWTKDGKEHPLWDYDGDLENVPEEIEQTVWLNAYPHEKRVFGCVHETREHADRSACKSRIACLEVKVRYRPGDGL